MKPTKTKELLMNVTKL